MKTLLLIGVIATAQCSSEPSGGPVTDESSPDAGMTSDTSVTDDAGKTVDAGAAESAEASGSEDEATRKPDGSAFKRLISTGPPPFTVPTTKIEWPQQRALVRVPQGTRLVGVGESATVILGEGTNFAYRVTPLGHATLEPNVEPRDDGARVWQEGFAWRFHVRTDSHACTNDLPDARRHDAADVEMMIASCRSIETTDE